MGGQASSEPVYMQSGHVSHVGDYSNPYTIAVVVLIVIIFLIVFISVCCLIGKDVQKLKPGKVIRPGRRELVF
jgi:hypothetical protein